MSKKPAAPALIYNVQREFDRVRDDLMPRLEKLAGTVAAYGDPEVQNVQVAQNVLRTCMEATLQKMLPYSHLTAVELAIRLASYALSTVPLEDQETVLAQFVTSFPDAHHMRMAHGTIIHTDWQMDSGVRQPNFPKGPILNPQQDV